MSPSTPPPPLPPWQQCHMMTTTCRPQEALAVSGEDDMNENPLAPLNAIVVVLFGGRGGTQHHHRHCRARRQGRGGSQVKRQTLIPSLRSSTYRRPWLSSYLSFPFPIPILIPIPFLSPTSSRSHPSLLIAWLSQRKTRPEARPPHTDSGWSPIVVALLFWGGGRALEVTKTMAAKTKAMGWGRRCGGEGWVTATTTSRRGGERQPSSCQVWDGEIEWLCVIFLTRAINLTLFVNRRAVVTLGQLFFMSTLTPNAPLHAGQKGTRECTLNETSGDKTP